MRIFGSAVLWDVYMSGNKRYNPDGMRFCPNCPEKGVVLRTSRKN